MDFNLQEPPASHFYRAFEDKHRGTRELIKQRLAVYLPFVRPLAELYPDLPVLDLGCGRGEWLELLQQHQIAAHGIDLDEGMLAASRERGLNVSNADALAHLTALADHSQLAVTGFHIAEHLPFTVLQALFAQAHRVLVPGGLFILETPNPENLVVGTASFYIDPTHQRPLPSQLLTFLAEYQGFARTKLLRLQEEARLAAKGVVGLYDVLANASPDYAIVAQVQMQVDAQTLEPAFSAECGISLDTLASRYDEQLQLQLAQLQLQLAQFRQQTQHLQQEVQHLRGQHAAQLQATQAAQQQAEQALALAHQNAARADQFAARADEFAAALGAVHASHSWRITRPLRWLARQFRSGSSGV